jgi:enterochelin esterase-like enzyme
MMRAASMCVCLVMAAAPVAPPPPPSPGTSMTREIASGESHEVTVQAAAGDLVIATFEMTGVAALVKAHDASGTVLREWYFMDPAAPNKQRLGFVAPVSGDYRVAIQAYDRFDSGTQVSPSLPVPVPGDLRGRYTLGVDRRPIAERMRGLVPPEAGAPTSGRLQQLARDVERSGARAVADFWSEVQGKGPLVESNAADDPDVLVTFVWRATYEIRNVLLLWTVSHDKADDYYLTPLAGTDVWFKTLRLRGGSRLAYTLSPNDRAEDRMLTSQLDPLHARAFPDDASYPFQRQSVVETPGAPDESWARRPPVRRGAIDQKVFRSALLQNDRDIWIYTPPGYDPKRGPYPFLLLFDGGAYVSPRFLNAPATLDNLINDGRIRPAVVGFLPTVNRAAEQGFNAGGAYGDAIVNELLPMLRASYAIASDPGQVVAGGFSNGGMAAAVLALRHSGAFGNVLSQSGSFRAPRTPTDEPNTISRMYLAERRLPIRFYLDAGLYDNAPGAGRVLHEGLLDQTNLMGNRHFRDVLLARGYEVIYRETGGAHDFLHWRAMLADGLMALLRPETR